MMINCPHTFSSKLGRMAASGGLLLSWTVTMLVVLVERLPIGVPLSKPVVGSNVNPGGTKLIFQV